MHGDSTPDPASPAGQKPAASPVERPCGLFRRLFAMLYDLLAVIVLLMVVTVVAMAFGMTGRIAGRDPAYTVGLAAVWFFYLAWSWKNLGMTLGMRAWRVHIVNDEGVRPGWLQCLVRFLVSILSAAAAGIGFIWSWFREDRKTWHDLASKTHLVHRKK